jgi:hypothetical protein
MLKEVAGVGAGVAAAIAGTLPFYSSVHLAFQEPLATSITIREENSYAFARGMHLSLVPAGSHLLTCQHRSRVRDSSSALGLLPHNASLALFFLPFLT